MEFINLAIIEGKKAYDKGEVPVGAVIVRDGEVIGRGHNLKETLKNPLAHAELIAIKDACKALGDWRLNGAEIYVTLEPCPMCASAIIQSRISKLYIGTFNRDMGACGSVVDIINNRYLNTSLNVEWLYDENCSRLITKFFDERRKEEP
ncbi:nucleoside deaminase [Clostridium chrysemydis]|uniref:nucleoside deaminase n=1 Tax=Clostridium chrysemydis TaxID=2665504 RepID=UPI001883D85B|nr:nucleoside deaminase [Clostridium chrysemydis]